MNTQGLSLADIGRLHEDVPVGDSFIRVHGISAEMALALLREHPEVLAKAMQGGGVKFNDIIKAAPDVVSAIVAAATGGKAADAKLVPIEIQMDILEAASRLTFKSGFGPFVKRITAMAEGGALPSASSGVVRDTNLQPASSV